MKERPVVLVVDDRRENLITIEAVLQPLDVTIQKAVRAERALHFLLEHDAAVILMDVEMPDMDGFEAARLIRQRPRSRDIPIIFVTAVERGGAAVREGYQLGAVDYIVKPFQPEILRWKVSVFAELYKSREKERLLIEEQTRRMEIEAVARRSRLLSDVSAILASSMNRESVLTRLVQRFVPESANCAVIFKRESGDSLQVFSMAAVDETETLVLAKHFDIRQAQKDPISRAMNLGSAVLIDSFDDYGHSVLVEPHRDFIERLRLRSGIFIPLHHRAAPEGILALYRGQVARFSPAEHLFIKELSDRIGLSLTNIELYEDSQQANRAKDEFLAVVSHELRTPLVTIAGWSNILLAKQLPPEAVQKALQTIQRSARIQTDLVSDILDFSRIATGTFSIKLQEVEIGNILKQTIEAMRPLAEAKKIDLALSAAKRHVLVTGDTRRLQQLFSNLLSNAIKFTPDGGHVSVTLNSDDRQVRVQIRDSGIGIEPEFLPHAFDPFVQADSSNTRRYAGLGLGLAIVRHLVELHDGQIEAKSRGPGRGSTFTVTFPVGRPKSRAS